MKALLALLITILSFNVFAHTGLKSSLPKNNAMLMETPKTLKLVFSEPARLAKVTLLTKNGTAIPFNFVPSATLASEYTYDLPTLSEDTYMVHWMLLGKDGHKMEGSFSFMVHAAPMKHNKKMHSNKHSSH